MVAAALMTAAMIATGVAAASKGATNRIDLTAAADTDDASGVAATEIVDPTSPLPASPQATAPAFTASAPADTRAEVGFPVPTSPAAPSDAPPVEAAPPAEPSLECAQALAAVEAAGLVLPEGTAFRCPGDTRSFAGDRQHSGVACWGNTFLCPGGSYIAVNPDATAAGGRHLRYVIAHEICHIQAYLNGEHGGTEPAADSCAALAGFPRP